MGTYKITIDYTDQSEALKLFDSPPERSFATAWIKSNHGLFRVNITVISIKSQQPEYYFSLADSKIQDIGKAVTDLVELTEKYPCSKDAPGL